jgi:hypothetical protein
MLPVPGSSALQSRQFFFHGYIVHRVSYHLGSKGHEHVHVAIRLKNEDGGFLDRLQGN